MIFENFRYSLRPVRAGRLVVSLISFSFFFLSAKTISYMRNHAINLVRLVERAYKIFLCVIEEF